MKMFRNCTIAALALAAASCFSGYRTEADAKALRVRRGTFASNVVLTGELRAARGEELAVARLPRGQATVKGIAPDGAVMKQGDPGCVLHSSTVSTNLAAQRLSGA